jgi:hypothetical protein
MSSLVDAQPDPEIIAPPANLDRRMVLPPPRTGAIRNILPNGPGPILPN